MDKTLTLINPSDISEDNPENNGLSLPIPPNNEKCFSLGDGKFEYITDELTKNMLVNAWEAINSIDMWDFVAQDIESFMFSDDPRVDAIFRKMEELGYHDHSGRSFASTLRNMQYLARNGEEKFKKLFGL